MIIASHLSSLKMPYGVKNFPAKPEAPRHYEPHRNTRQKHLSLMGKIFFEESRLEATAYLVMQGISDSTQIIQLDARELNVSKVSVRVMPVWNLEQIETLESHPFGEVPFSNDNEKISLTLPHPLKAGEHVCVRIDYITENPKAGMYFVHKLAQSDSMYNCVWTQGQDTDSPYWFPCQDEPRLKITTLLKMTFPAHWHGMGNGKLLSENVAGNYKTQTWYLSQPHAPYLTAFTAGEFSFGKRIWRGKDVTVLVPESLAGLADSLCQETANMLEFYSNYWDFEYPWNKYGQAFVADFLYGGMENTSATINTDRVLGPDLFMNGDENKTYLIMHEMAHQWFGNTVTCETWSEGWLNEGFATHSEMLWDEHSNGKTSGIFYALEHFLEGYLHESESYLRPLVSNHYEFVSEIFDAHLYQKGALVLNHLRDWIGEKSFRNVVKKYLQVHAFKPVTTINLMNAVEEVTGKNPRHFFDTFIYRGGHVNLEVEICTNAFQEHFFEILITQKQAINPEFPVFEFNSWLHVEYLDKTSEEIPISIARMEEKVSIFLKKEVAFLIFDPRSTVVGKCKQKFPEGFAKKIILSETANGYFKYLAAKNIIEHHCIAQNLKLVTQWLAKESSFRARAAGYKILGSGQILGADKLLDTVTESHPIALVGWLNARVAATLEDAPTFVEILFGIAHNIKEVIAVRQAALSGIETLIQRVPELRIGRTRAGIVFSAGELTKGNSYLGMVEANAYKIIGNIADISVSKDLLERLHSGALPERLQIGILTAISSFSARFPESRFELRPSLLKYSCAQKPVKIIALLPILWLASNDSHYDDAFNSYINRKNYGLFSLLIPRARRFYELYLKKCASSFESEKLAEFGSLKEKVGKMEKEMANLKLLLESKKSTLL